jgi:HPt (histidine-containing phosphotransfer) domain-containing protein
MVMVMDGDRDALREIVALLIRQTTEQLDSLRSAAAAGNLQEVGRLAHTIKGAAAALTAERLRVIAQSAEKTARDGHAEGLSAAASRLQAALEELSGWAATELELDGTGGGGLKLIE